MTKCRRINLAVVLALSIAPAATADTVSTSDGSTIVGTIQQIANGKLVLLTTVAGRLEIDTSMVTGITTDKSVNVELTSGDTLVGTVEAAAEVGTVVVRSEVGDISAATSSISSMWPADAENPKLVAKLEAATPKWTVTLEGGVTRKEGNTDTLEGHGRFDVNRRTPDDLLRFYLAGKYNEQNKERTTNEYWGGIRYENNFSSRAYWYARTELEFDEFEDIDLRATAAAGFGRYWLKEADHELKTNAGAGYRHETYDGGRTENDFVLDLGLDYRADLTEWMHFTHSTVYSPNIEDFDNYRIAADTALLLPLKDDRWSWKLGIRNEYNSNPQPGLDRLDNTYYTSLVLQIR